MFNRLAGNLLQAFPRVVHFFFEPGHSQKRSLTPAAYLPGGRICRSPIPCPQADYEYSTDDARSAAPPIPAQPHAIQQIPGIPNHTAAPAPKPATPIVKIYAT